MSLSALYLLAPFGMLGFPNEWLSQSGPIMNGAPWSTTVALCALGMKFE